MEPNQEVRTFDWSRRDFIRGLGISGAAAFALGRTASAQEGTNTDQLFRQSMEKDIVHTMVVRYETDPERIQRMLPPPLEVDDPPICTIDFYVRHPATGTENIFFPAAYTESGFHVAAKYKGNRGMLMVGMPLKQEWGRSKGRERIGLVKKDGDVSLVREGRTVRAILRRRGKLLYHIETEITDEAAHPRTFIRETGYGAFLYRRRFNPDWQNELLGPEPIGLWRHVLAGRLGEWPEEFYESEPRVCVPSKTRVDFVESSPLDPFAEFPVRKVVEVSYSETDLAPESAREYRGPRTGEKNEWLENIDPEAFAPYAWLGHDRPVSSGKVWIPSGWPEKRSAWVLTKDELRQYRKREALRLNILRGIDVRLGIDAAKHRKTLPPGIEPGTNPGVRMLALDVDESDVSTVPFREFWLMSACVHEGKPAWYLLSHIVGDGGDIAFGRETFGYPSKVGVVTLDTDEGAVFARGNRLGRDFVRLTVPVTGAPKRGQQESAAVIGLRMHPPYSGKGKEASEPYGELVAQPWTLDTTEVREVHPESVALAFPKEKGVGRIKTPDPWYEFEDGNVESAAVIFGALERMPGKALGELSGFRPYFVERYDGADGRVESITSETSPTFLVNQG